MAPTPTVRPKSGARCRRCRVSLPTRRISTNFSPPSSDTALQARTSCSCLELSTHGIEVAGGKSPFREAVPKAGEAVRKSRRFACLRLLKHVLSAEVCSSF
jgi:hypothetical protein